MTNLLVFGFNSFSKDLVMRVAVIPFYFQLGSVFKIVGFKTSSVVPPGLKEVLIVKVKRSNDTRNKSSMCYAQVLWFGAKGNIGPRYIGCFWKLRRFGR